MVLDRLAPGLSRNAPVISRYPIMSACLAAAIQIPFLALFGKVPEYAFRLLPMAVCVLLSWLVAAKVSSRTPLRVMAAVMVATIPLVRYYSSILYLETTAVLLMTVVLFDAEELLRREPRRLAQRPSWLCLILIGFIKETTLPFLGAFLLCRLSVRWLERERGVALGRYLAQEARIGFCLLFPLALFLGYRTFFSSGMLNGLTWDLSGLTAPELYSIKARSWLEQFGALLVPAFLGIVLTVGSRRWAVPIFAAAAFIADLALYLFGAGEDFLGYSRLNLFLLPSLLWFARGPSTE